MKGTRTRRGPVLAAVAVAVAMLAVIATSLASGPGASAAADKFSPKQIAGKWVGTWKNTTFGSEGAIRANVKYKDQKLIALIDFDGTTFGCADPEEEIFKLKKGDGDNKWNADGFKVDLDTDGYGHVKGAYKHETNKTTLKGTNVKCQDGTQTGVDTWKLSGKLTGKKFSADVTINFIGGGDPAKAKLNAEKQ